VQQFAHNLAGLFVQRMRCDSTLVLCDVTHVLKIIEQLTENIFSSVQQFSSVVVSRQLKLHS
jgi:hypothetical protein